MGNLGHQAARLAASKICDNIVKGLCKDPETEVVKLIDMWQKFMGDEKIDLNYDSARKMICDKDCTLNKYMHRLINEIDPHVLKTIALNLGFEAFVYGTKTIRKNREKYGCNVPWLILMDPTSACNLHCTGCWAAEYGHKLNLTFDEMDKVVTQGKELGVYLYMFTGGEPLVRKADLVKLCEKHSDCAFLAFTNGTLVDEAFCADLKRIGNLYLAISLEGFSEVNDLRRGTGVFAKVMHAMDLLKENGLVFALFPVLFPHPPSTPAVIAIINTAAIIFLFISFPFLRRSLRITGLCISTNPVCEKFYFSHLFPPDFKFGKSRFERWNSSSCKLSFTM